MIEVILYLLFNCMDYNIDTHVKLNLKGTSDSSTVATVTVDDHLVVDKVKLRVPTDYRILGKNIYYASFDYPEAINSGTCTQIIFSSIGNKSESKLYFVVNNSVVRSINKFLISYDKDELRNTIKELKDYSSGICHDMTPRACFNGINSYKKLPGMYELNNIIYGNFELIGTKDLEQFDLSILVELYASNPTLGVTYSLCSESSKGRFKVDQITLLQDGNVILKINNYDYVLGINCKAIK